MLIGYARVSTHEQTLALQQDTLQKAGCNKIFTDTTSGAIVERKGLDEALNYIRKGDTLAVWRLDRLGRSLPHGSSAHCRGSPPIGGISVDTIRRRLQKGELNGQKQAGTHGHIWLIELEDETEHSNRSADRLAGATQGNQACTAGCQAEINRLEDTIAMLRERFAVQDAELEARRREVQELHVLLQTTQAALPAPREGRSWWKWLFGWG
jgi:hypothetical protein